MNAETEVFEGSVEPKGDAVYYDHIAGETKTGWKPSVVVQYPWMKTFFKYNKPAVKEYNADEKGIKKWIYYEFSYMEQQTPSALKFLIKRYSGIRDTINDQNTDELKNSTMGFLFAHFNHYALELKRKGKGKKGVDAFYQSIVDYIDIFVSGTNGVKGAKQWLEEKQFNSGNDPVHHCKLCDKFMQNVKQSVEIHEKSATHQKHVEASLTGTKIKANLTKNSRSRCLGCLTIIRGDISNLKAHWATPYCIHRSPLDKMGTYEESKEEDEEKKCKIKKPSGMSVYQREQEIIRQEKAKEEERIFHLKKLEKLRKQD